MARFTIVVLIAVAAILAGLLYKETSALRMERSKVQELTRKADFDFQERCARRAEESFKFLGYKSDSGDILVNHYNPRLNKCFMETTSTLLKSKNLSVVKIVTDASEGKEYGEFGGSNQIVVICKVRFLSGEEKTCNSKDEFDTMVKQYLE